MALKLDILANTRQFVSEMKKAGASTEDITDALDDIAKDGDKAGEKVEKSFKDLARQADTTGRKVGTSFDDGFDKAKRGADEFKDEANSTAREAAASFDGSAESIGDAFQEISANALAGFGPLGAAGGLAAALGIGALLSGITEAQEATAELKQNMADMYLEAAEDGRAYLTETQIMAEANRILFEDRDKIQREAKAIGIDAVTLARAYAGSEEDANTALQIGNEKLAERLDTLDMEGRYGATKVQAVDEESRAIEGVTGQLEQQLEWHKQNKDAAEDVAESIRRSEGETRRQSQATKEAIQKNADALRSAFANPVTLRVNVDQSGISSAAYALRRLQDQAARGVNVVSRSGRQVIT